MLTILVAIFLRLYFKPAAPDAPVASVWNVVTMPTQQANSNANTQQDDVEEDGDMNEEDMDQAQENEWEVEVVLPDAPLADIKEIDSFNDTIDGNGVSFSLVSWSEVQWVGKKVWGQHNGYVEISEGEMYVVDGEIMEWRFVMDMTSINATDIDDDSLDNAIKWRFNTEEHPTAEFFLNEASDTQVSWVMTINGQSREISFPATLIVEDDTVIANADFALDRTQWGVDGWTPAVSEFMELSFNLTWMAE